MKTKYLTLALAAIALLLATLTIPAASQGLLIPAADLPNAPNADAIVDVAHFAPFADAGVAGSTSVTVRVNGGDALTNFEFGDIAQDIALAPGDYLIEILPGGMEPAAISGNVTLADGVTYTLAAIGDGVNQPLELFAVEQDVTPDATNAKLFIGHLAPFANTAAGTSVDICTDAGAAVLTDFVYKEFTDPYLSLPPGDYDLQIQLAADPACSGAVALDIPSVRLAAGDIVDVFATGLANNWPLGVASTTGFDLTPAIIDVAHFAPFADAGVADSTSVTVQVDGADALTDFQFGDIAQDIELPGGDYLIEILPGGMGPAAISETVTVMDGESYTLAAIGDGSNQPLELLALAKDTLPDMDNAKLFVGHLAPFANTAAGTAVDICTDGGAAVLTDFVYKEITDPYLVLPPGDYDLQILLAADPACSGGLALDIPSLRLAAGDIVDVFAIGLANNWPLSVTSTTGFELTPALVDVAHFAPFADAMTAGSTSVTVQVDGADALTNFEFGDIAEDIELAPGDYLIEILPGGIGPAAISETVTVIGGQSYTLAAIGDGSNQPLELAVLEDDLMLPAAGEGKLRVAHFAPFAADIADTQVDICTEDNAVVVADVPFNGVTDPYLTLPSGFYNLKVTAAGTSCGTLIFDIPWIGLGNQQIASVFAVGGANNWAPTAITLPDLLAIVNYLPVIKTP